MFLTVIVRYVESQFTLLTSELETYHCNTLRRKGTEQQQNKTKSLPGLLSVYYEQPNTILFYKKAV